MIQVALSKDRGLYKLALLLALLLPLVHSQLEISSVTATSLSLGSSATYTFQFLRLSTQSVITLDSSLVLTFDNAYNGLLPSSPICSWSSSSFASTPVTCSSIGTILTLPALFNNSSYFNIISFSVVVGGIVNPSPAKTYIPVNLIQIKSVSNTVIDSGTSIQSIIITPLSAQCTSSLLNGFVFTKGQLTVNYGSNLISGNANSTYTLSVSVPSFYPDDATQSLIDPVFNQNYTFQNLGNNHIFTFPYVNSFTITLLMPPSNKPQNNIITITTSNNNGNLDTCTLSLINVTPSTFTSLTISSAIIQTTSPLTFNLLLSTPLIPSDQLQLSFPSTFDLTQVPLSSSVSITGHSNFPMTRLGNLLKLTVNTTTSILNANLIFTITNIGLPFTAAGVPVQVSLLTFDGYLRIDQTSQYSPLTGSLGTAISCVSVEIGASTTCQLSLTTSNSLTSDAIIQISINNGFPVPQSNKPCTINGAGLASVATCLYYNTNSTIHVTNLNISFNNILPLSFTVNIPLTLSTSISNYTLTANTLSAGQQVDTGTATLTTTSRQLTGTQLILSSSSTTTYSATIYSLTIALPFDPGFPFNIAITLPVDLQTGFTQPTITNADFLLPYTSPTITAVRLGLLNTIILVNNLLTPISTAPLTVTINLSNNGILMFYSSQTITMTVLRIPNTLTGSQSNQIVYNSYTATLTISDLAINDNIRLFTTFTYFYDTSNQTTCTSAIATCPLTSPTLKVNSVGNNNLTTLSVQLINQAYIGSYSLIVEVYDSNNAYGKQSGTVSLTTSSPNFIVVNGSQNNPYLNQASTYTFSLNFTTPNATILLLSISSDIIIIKATCLQNCGTPTPITGGFIFSVTSSWMILTVEVTNPIIISPSTKFSFASSSLQGSKDAGEHQPIVACASPCRSCDLGLCLSCYSWGTFPYLLNGTCIVTCPGGYYTSNNICLTCTSPCSSCSQGTTCDNCQTGFFLYKGACISACPSDTYLLANGTCILCTAPCATCINSPTNCTSCLSSFNSLLYYYLNNNCLTACPPDHYKPLTNNTCLPCNSSCLTCSHSACLSCLSTQVLYNGSCYSSCPQATYPANSSTCLGCAIQCSSCISSSACTGCVTSYYLINSTQSCLSVCPRGYYNQGTVCVLCPSLCDSCSLINQRVVCSSCVTGALIQEWLCVNNCSIGIASGGYCVSSNCSSLSQCLLCTGARCLQCNSLYSLSPFTCIQSATATLPSTIPSLSQIPVPFPFLISIIMIIILAFFLRHNYPKMFSPLFIYALAGVLQQLCLILWTILTLLWNYNQVSPLPLISVAYAPALILVCYGSLNLAQLVCWRCIIATDRKYKLWEKQDNKCASVFIAILGTFLSFRLDTLKFSRTAHSYRLSARLTDPELFKHYGVLGGMGMVVSAGSILSAVYISSLQASMNYLFFNCLEVAILSVLMIILSVVVLCVPKQQLLEDKNQFTYGHDQDQIEGPSLQEILQAVQEYHSHGDLGSDTGAKVVMRRRQSFSQDNSQDLTLAMPNKLLLQNSEGISFSEEQGDQARVLFAKAETDYRNPSLDEFKDKNRLDAMALVQQYLQNEAIPQPLGGRQPGSISKQKILELPQEDSDPSNFGDFQEFKRNEHTSQWVKASKENERKDKRELRQQFGHPDEQIDQIRKQLLMEAQEKERQRHQALLRQQIGTIAQLKGFLGTMDKDEQKLRLTCLQLQHKEEALRRKQQEQVRERRERALMQVQDKLTSMAILFESMRNVSRRQTDITHRHKKIAQLSHQEQPSKLSMPINYHNRESDNLKDQMSPKRVKINPRPSPQQFKRQHLFVEEAGVNFQQSLSQTPDSDIPPIEPIQNLQLEKEEKAVSHERVKTAKVRRQVVVQSKGQKRDNSKMVLTQEVEDALAPIHYAHYKNTFGDIQEENQQVSIPHKISNYPQLKCEQSRNMEVQEEEHFQIQNQITVYEQELISMQDNDLISQSSHPVAPALQQHIYNITRRADAYITGSAKHANFQYHPSEQQQYEEEQYEGDLDQMETINEIVYEDRGEELPVGGLKTSGTKKIIRHGRVNRRIIDLSPLS